MKEIYPGIFCAEIPLPNYPLGAGRMYVIKGDRNLIIDSGLNNSETKRVFLRELSSIGIQNFSNTDFFITHSHNDHMDLLDDLDIADSSVYCHKIAADMFSNGHDQDFKNRIRKFSIINGFDKDTIDMALHSIPLNEPHKNDINFVLVEPGQTLNYGIFNFNIIEAPGHSLDHLVLYESQHKLLFTGDHVSVFNPQITIHKYGDDILGAYLSSITGIAKLQIDLTMPFHNKTIDSFSSRVEEIVEYYEGRFDEVIGLIKDKPQTAFQIAAQLSWPFSWKKTRIYAHLSSLLVVCAYLEHMMSRGLTTKLIRQDIYYWSTT